MMGEEEKWEGSVSVEVSVGAQRVWEVARGFCAMHEWAGPRVSSCERVAGGHDPQGPGCVRRVTSSGDASAWVTEELLAIDDLARSFSYRAVGASAALPPLHLHNYVARFQVLASASASSASASSSIICWSFRIDPMPARIISRHHFVSFISSVLTSYIRSLERFLLDRPSAA
jgi:hypothetical protein